MKEIHSTDQPLVQGNLRLCDDYNKISKLCNIFFHGNILEDSPLPQPGGQDHDPFSSFSLSKLQSLKGFLRISVDLNGPV